jgi:hypothetical protein
VPIAGFAIEYAPSQAIRDNTAPANIPGAVDPSMGIPGFDLKYSLEAVTPDGTRFGVGALGITDVVTVDDAYVGRNPALIIGSNLATVTAKAQVTYSTKDGQRKTLGEERTMTVDFKADCAGADSVSAARYKLKPGEQVLVKNVAGVLAKNTVPPKTVATPKVKTVKPPKTTRRTTVKNHRTK